jgi:hypothetical protein
MSTSLALLNGGKQTPPVPCRIRGIGRVRAHGRFDLACRGSPALPSDRHGCRAAAGSFGPCAAVPCLLFLPRPSFCLPRHGSPSSPHRPGRHRPPMIRVAAGRTRTGSYAAVIDRVLLRAAASAPAASHAGKPRQSWGSPGAGRPAASNQAAARGPSWQQRRGNRGGCAAGHRGGDIGATGSGPDALKAAAWGLSRLARRGALQRWEAGQLRLGSGRLGP